MPTQSGVSCSRGHSFDRAREGYLNLLPSGRHGRSGTPGDTPESLQARRRFLHAGWYLPIATAVVDKLGNNSETVLDVGCGEGWYLSHLVQPHLCGVDISKRAVQMASKFLPHAEFCVGSAHRLPVSSQSCDAVFSVFAPHSYQEFARVLRPGGQWVTVTPASHHLHEMRPKRSDSIDERERRRSEPPSEADNAERLTFSLNLSHEAATDLFTMTPLQWQTAAAATPTTSVTVDVWVGYGTTI